MHAFIPLWIIGGPFVGLLILFFSFKGPSAMGGLAPRLPPRGRAMSVQLDNPARAAAPLLQPMHPEAPRRLV